VYLAFLRLTQCLQSASSVQAPDEVTVVLSDLEGDSEQELAKPKAKKSKKDKKSVKKKKKSRAEE
jgi:hypothetical protein